MLLTWFNKVKGYSQSRQGDFLGFVKLEVIIFISFHILYIEPKYIFPQKLLSLFVKTIIILKVCPSKFNIVHFFMLYNHMFCSFWNPQDYAVFTLSLYYNWTKNSTITFTFFCNSIDFYFRFNLWFNFILNYIEHFISMFKHWFN